MFSFDTLKAITANNKLETAACIAIILFGIVSLVLNIHELLILWENNASAIGKTTGYLICIFVMQIVVTVLSRFIPKLNFKK